MAAADAKERGRKWTDQTLLRAEGRTAAAAHHCEEAGRVHPVFTGL